MVPVLTLRGFVMFPNIMLHFDIGRKKSILAVEEAMNSNQLIFLTTQKDVRDDDPKKSQIYKFGVLATVKQILKQTGDTMRVLVEGKCRAEATEYIEDDKYLKAKIIKKESIEHEKSTSVQALIRKSQKLFAEYLSVSPKIPGDMILSLTSQKAEAGKTADYIASNVLLSFEEKQTLLEELDTVKRLKKLILFLSRENEILKYEDELGLKLKESIDESQKEYFLREQIRVLSQELGEESDPVTESDEYRKKLEKLKLPKDTYEKLIKECDNFAKTPAGSSEANLIRGYLDNCISLPWNTSSKDVIDIDKAEKILDKDHFGLSEVKERIIEFLAVKKLAPDIKGQIICLVGPPGVGKTSIAKSLAKAIGKKYVRISLGGINDESEIRGHRKTYIGAMPGRIISAIKQAGTNNPLILFDEIDKLSKDYHGDPASALLEALDPEQNSEFYDRFLEVPFDLGRVLFVATANDKNAIPQPLYDRMEIIELYSYNHEEKFNIAKDHLVPKQIKRHGLTKKNFKIKDEALKILIENYTREAGVRELERKIAALMRKTAKSVAENKEKLVEIDAKKLKYMLGSPKYKKEKTNNSGEVGVVKGLAWTSVGGETMPIEVALMKGKGKVQVTGSLGDVMKESAQIAVSYIRSNSSKLGIKEDFYKNFDIHIHAPEGAVPKDGPSAGITMTTALVSALSNIPVKPDVAMTGEITLKGKVLPIGGLKEKTMAAYKDGVKTVIIPSANESDLEKIDTVVKNNVNFVMADDLDAVFKYALSGKKSALPKTKSTSILNKKSLSKKSQNIIH